MNTDAKQLEALIDELPPELCQEVADFARYLLDTKVKRKQRKLPLDWAGGLEEFRHQFTSLELQQKANEWRGD